MLPAAGLSRSARPRQAGLDWARPGPGLTLGSTLAGGAPAVTVAVTSSASSFRVAFQPEGSCPLWVGLGPAMTVARDSRARRASDLV